MPKPSLLGVAAALPLEARALRYGGAGLLLEVTGIGAAQAAAGARRLVQAGATALLSWGTAAGLTPGLAPGAVAFPQVVIDADGQRFAADAAWHRRLLRRLGGSAAPIIAPLAASGEVLRGPEEKRALHLRTGAVVADMESGALARVACESAIPFLALRVVLDPVAGVLPDCVTGATDDRGELAVSRLLAAAAVRPGDWVHLLALIRWFSVARRALGRLAHHAEPDLFALGAP
jgi:adenosylhomocysteine nucleosidase